MRGPVTGRSPNPDGTARSALGLGFDIRFRAVVLADEDVQLRWTVESSAWKRRAWPVS